MERFNKLIQDEDYKLCLEKIRVCEKERIFCRHDVQHFLDVARLCYILALESGCDVSKEVIYTCAFLHDIGKWQQYTENIPHETASHQLAKPLLEKYRFDENEQQQILSAILQHRKGAEKGLGRLMYQSDKLSRDCRSCKAYTACNWTEEAKNNTISY